MKPVNVERSVGKLELVCLCGAWGVLWKDGSITDLKTGQPSISFLGRYVCPPCRRGVQYQFHPLMAVSPWYNILECNVW